MQLQRTSPGTLLVLLGLSLSGLAVAENVDPDNDDSQYAWAENAGWFSAEQDTNEDGIESEICLAHGDLNMANIICDRADNIWFIDWTHTAEHLDFAENFSPRAQAGSITDLLVAEAEIDIAA